MMIDDLRSKAIEAHYRVVDMESGIGIEFSDGFDVFWVLPDDVISTIDFRSRASLSTSAIFDEFVRINSARRDLIKVVRLHSHRRNSQIDEYKSGSWCIEERSGGTWYIDVGMVLTNRIHRGETVYGIVKSMYFPGQRPSRDRIKRYLSSPDVNEPIPVEVKSTPKACGIRGVLAMIFGSRALRIAGDLASRSANDAEAIVEIAKSRGKGVVLETLMQLDKLLPEVEAFVEFSHRSINLAFSGARTSYSIDFLSQEFRELVKRLGSVGAARNLATEYQRIDALRNRVIFTVESIANRRGWRREERSGIFTANQTKWYYGDHFVSVKLLPGDELTDAVKQFPLDQVFEKVLSGNNDFTNECMEHLTQSEEVHEIRVESTRLAPPLPMNTPDLLNLDQEVIHQMDDFARSHKDTFFNDRWSLGKYRDRLYWNGPNDTWASMEDWIALSDASIAPEFFTAQSVLIYSDASHDSADEYARRYLNDCQIHDEMGEDEIEVIWKYRQEYPALARELFCGVEYPDDTVMRTRARIGDPVALRYWYEKYAEPIMDGTYWEDNRIVPIDPERLSKSMLLQYHEESIRWASSTWGWSPPEFDKIRMALDLGFGDVGELFEKNEYIVKGLLRPDCRHSQFDEPGILWGGSFLLAWSILKPTSFLARLLATAVLTDFLGIAFAYYHQAMEKGELTIYEREVTETSTRRNWEDMQLELAIAWLRCRSRLGENV